MHHMGGEHWTAMELGNAARSSIRTNKDRKRGRQLGAESRQAWTSRWSTLYDLSLYIHAGGLLPALADLQTPIELRIR